ncbi:hypothetical protein HYH03_008639 [Edaphochlamys debaryana]|uniref:KIF-binding protein n=1 Tax=Edaphochlamys debaryana TaxID=47281 RepID=A0A835Y212_9CHLO|nr:hypothetical protein HYH03_008639 [Edaphochlamys debaryana]|eukprot:KAG2493223.1 hypothetical protein HYH03_008639 [Edaphochlamys debaryana]
MPTESAARSVPELVSAIKRACALSLQPESEDEPYKHKYEAADILRLALGEKPIAEASPADSSAPAPPAPPASADAPSEDTSAAEPGSEPSTAPAAQSPASSSAPDAVPSEPSDLELAAACARIRSGLLLLETDLLPDGEAAVTAGLPVLEAACAAAERHAAAAAAASAGSAAAAPAGLLGWQLEAYNALGALYSARGEMERALTWLSRAEALYQRLTASGARTAHLALRVAGLRRSEGEGTEAKGAKEGEPAKEAGKAAVNGSEGQAKAGAGQEAGAPESAEAGTATAAAGVVEAEAAGQGAIAAAAAAAAPAEEAPAPAPAPAAGGLAPAAPAASQPPFSASSPPLHELLPGCSGEAVQAHYTSTLYYLAQVYGHMKLSDKSALYCAATLYRQLAGGKYDIDTWVNNCLQLGGYYAKVHAYGLAMYCHAAAQAVVDRDTAAGAELGEDTAANIKLAMARVYHMRLAASHARSVEGKPLEQHYPDVSHFPDYLRFQGLKVAAPDSFPWGEAALAKDFEGARELFNAGMPLFKEATAYYALDGWVTDHVGILMDLSNMYRCLAGFEPDPSRVAAMHRCRAQLLEPLSGGLNPTHYPGLSRSIDLELAHVYREISDVREEQGGQKAKAAAAAASAAKYYQRFIASFVNEATGQLPDRIDSDNEPYFLMASFGLGRVLHRVRPGTGATAAGVAAAAAGGVAGGAGAGGRGGKEASAAAAAAAAAAEEAFPAMAMAAHQHLQWTRAYVKRHGLETWMEEAQAAEELSELLVEQMRLRARAAAAGGGGSR